MTTTKKRLCSFLLVLSVAMSSCISIAATDVEPNSSRFRYFTETDPNWTYNYTSTVTQEQSENYRYMEDLIWKGMTLGLSDDDDGGIPILSDVAGFINEIIQESNADLLDAGTYVFYYKYSTRYKEHLLTGDITVEQRQILYRIEFTSGGKTEVYNRTFTLR